MINIDQRKVLRKLSELLNTNIENVPNVLTRFKREIEELENKLGVNQKSL